MKDQQELDAALAEVNEKTKALNASSAAIRPQPSPAPTGEVLKSWTVKMKDGTVYPGVKALSAEEAARKMMEGPAGVLAPPPFKPAPGREMPTPAPRTPAGSANFTGLPEAASGAGMLAAGPAIAGAGLATDMLSDKPPEPTTGKDIAGNLVPLAVGALSRPARTLPSAIKSVLGNVLGRGAVEGGIAAASGEESPLAATIGGAAKGVLPGLAQAGIGAAVGPTRDTLQVQKAAKALRGELSPELAKLIDPNKPASLLSRNTVKSLRDAAGANLDKVEADITGKLGDQRFTIGANAQAAPGFFSAQGTPIKGGIPAELMARIQGKPAGQSFEEIRAKIKDLRSIGDKQYGSPEMARTARAAMQDARELEQSLLKQMPSDLATQYKSALQQHAKDSEAIRWLKDVQKQNSVSGGANPIDRPGLGKAQEAISQKGGPLKTALHGALGATEAVMGKGIGAAYHLGRAADTSRMGQGPLKPQKTVPSLLPKITSGVGGSAVGGLQSLLLKKLQPKEEE